MDRGADKTSPGDDYWPPSQLWIPCARWFNVLYLLCLFRLLCYSALFQGAQIHKYTNSGNQFNPPPPLSQGLRFKVCFEWPSPRPAYQVDQVDTKWCNVRQEIVWFQSVEIFWQTKIVCQQLATVAGSPLGWSWPVNSAHDDIAVTTLSFLRLSYPVTTLCRSYEIVTLLHILPNNPPLHRHNVVTQQQANYEGLLFAQNSKWMNRRRESWVKIISRWKSLTHMREFEL